MSKTTSEDVSVPLTNLNDDPEVLRAEVVKLREAIEENQRKLNELTLKILLVEK